MTRKGLFQDIKNVVDCIPCLNVSKKNSLLILTGAGSSIDFGIPGTNEITDFAEQLLLNNGAIKQFNCLPLYFVIKKLLGEYLINPGTVNFEHIYHAIDLVHNFLDKPDKKAFDEFRPIVAGIADVKDELKDFNSTQSSWLRREYLISIIKVILDRRATVSPYEIRPLTKLFKNLSSKYKIISATLNYDDLFESAYPAFRAGFPNPEAHSCEFDAQYLSKVIDNGSDIHMHLHGSIRWGWATGRDFGLNEFLSPQEAFKTLGVHSSGSKTQSGHIIHSGTIVTGLGKTEATLRQPFWEYLNSFNQLCDTVDILIIAGYGFNDYHINIGLERLRWNRPTIPTYVVDFLPEDYSDIPPYDWVDDPQKPHLGVLGIDADSFFTLKEDPKRTGWWDVPGINHKKKTGPLKLWIGGFKTFCADVSEKGLPVFK